MNVDYVNELRIQRVNLLDEIEGLLRRAQGEGGGRLSPEDRRQHDDAVARYEMINGQLERTQGITRAGWFDAPPAQGANVVLRDFADPELRRSLDAMLWATAETVQAGNLSERGVFTPSGARNPVERVVVRSQQLGEIQAPRLDAFDPASQVAVAHFQQTVADMAVFGLLVDKQAMSSAQGFEVARSHKLFKDRWQYVCRAMDVDTAGEGGTWVPTGIGAALHARVRAAGKVAALFQRIDLPSNPWKWPIEGADAIAYRVAEPTTDTESAMTASTPGSVAATFDAEIFGARALVSKSLEADAAAAMVPYVQSKIVRAFVTAEERAILDGDTDGTHQDSDVGASTTDARTAWDGLRKKGLAQTATNTAAALDVSKLAALRTSMGKWGINPADLAFIVGTSNFYRLVTDEAVVSVDKMGPNATILNGQLGSLYGIPLIVSEYVREDLNASGVHDGITTTKTYALCVNRAEWAIGQRMALDVEVDDSVFRQTYQRLIIGFAREDVQCLGEAATNEDTAIGYGVTP